jgi:DNA-binding LacI/PurR family transcriptional regulator
MVTLKVLAEKSGYSITTVSRALAGYNDVSESTRQHIESIALALGYQPNMVARQLRARRTDTVGMIVPVADNRFADDFFSELVMSVGHAASQHGYDLLVSAKTSADEMAAYRRIVGGNRVDGVIIARVQRADPRIAYLQTAGQPFVVMGRAAPDEPTEFPYVDVDSGAGIRQIVGHLVGLGHRSIGLLLPPPQATISAYRHEGFLAGLADAGIPASSAFIRHSDLSRQGGEQAAHDLLAAHPHLSAIVACNDLMALGAMDAARALGRHAGRDIAITGFDDIPAAEYTQPGLTTVRQPIAEIGQHLLEMLIQVIHHNAPPNPHVLLPPEIVVRASCGSRQERRTP